MNKTILFALLGILVLTTPLAQAYEGANTASLKATLLNQDPDPAIPGEYVELRWKIEKHGNAAFDNVTFMLEPQYPFSFDASETSRKNIGAWTGFSNDDEYYTLYYKLRVDELALEDSYKIELKFMTGNTNTYTKKEYEIRVGEDDNPELILGKIKTQPTKLLPDTDENSISISLHNVGIGAAEQVTAQLILPDGFSPSYSYSDRVSLGTLGAAETQEAEFFINIDDIIKEGAYSTELLLSYKEEDEDGLQQLRIPFTLDTKNKPTFTVQNISFSDVLSPGNTVKVFIELENAGSKKTQSVSVRAFKKTSQPFDFSEKSDFIGTLDVDQTGQAILELTIDDAAQEKKYYLDIEIRSIDNGIVFIQEETVPLAVTSQKSTNNSVVPYILGVLVVGILVFCSFYLGKSSMLENNTKLPKNVTRRVKSN